MAAVARPAHFAQECGRSSRRLRLIAARFRRLSAQPGTGKSCNETSVCARTGQVLFLARGADGAKGWD